MSNKKPELIAHRGFSEIEKENTMAAFIAAGNRGCFGIETDVHKTKDGKFVTIHDGNTERVSGIDFSIEQNNYEDIFKLCLLDKDGKPRSDLRVPLLEDYIKICKRYNKVAVIELKGQYPKEDIKGIIDIIKSMEYLEKVIFIAFDWDNLVYVRELSPNQPVQYLSWDYTDELLNKLIENQFGIDIDARKVTKEMVDKLHEHGLMVNCWYIDPPEIIEKLIGFGVDYLTVDNVE